MKIFNTKQSGLVLIETMLAIAMLAIGVVVAGNYLNAAIESQVYSRDFLIANNIADEGVEMMKALRNTNWLQHPSDTSAWLDISPFTSTNTPPITGNDNYYIFYNSIGSQKLEMSNVQDTTGHRGLDLSVSSDTMNNNFILHSCPNSYQYSQNPDTSGACDYEPTTDNTNFYRSINFDTVSDTAATFTVKVQWDSINGIKTINRTTTMYNK